MGWQGGDRRVLAQGIYEVMTTDLRGDLARRHRPGHRGLWLERGRPTARAIRWIRAFARASCGCGKPRRFERIEGAQHMVMIDRPRQFMAAVEEFLAQPSASTSSTARPVAVQLALPHAGHPRQGVQRAGLGHGDLQQGPVLENHIGRHVLFGGPVAAPGAQPLEPLAHVGGQGLQHRRAALTACLAVPRIRAWWDRGAWGRAPPPPCARRDRPRAPPRGRPAAAAACPRWDPPPAGPRTAGGRSPRASRAGEMSAPTPQVDRAVSQPCTSLVRPVRWSMTRPRPKRWSSRWTAASAFCA